MTSLDERRLEQLIQLLSQEAPVGWSRCETPEELRFPHALTVRARVEHCTIYVTQSLDSSFPSSLRHDVRISPLFQASIVFLMSEVGGCAQRLIQDALDALTTHQEE